MESNLERIGRDRDTRFDDLDDCCFGYFGTLQRKPLGRYEEDIKDPSFVFEEG